MFKTIEHLVHEFGLIGLFIDILLETLGAPLPGESLIIFAAGMAVDGQLNIYSVAAVVFVAAVCGDNIGYVIGRRLGRSVVLEYGARIGFTEARLNKVEMLVERRGVAMIIAARFIAIARQLNGVTAGTLGLSWPRFFAADLVGCAAWSAFWTGLVFLIGEEKIVLPYIWNHLSVVASVVMALLLLGLFFGWIFGRFFK